MRPDKSQGQEREGREGRKSLIKTGRRWRPQGGEDMGMLEGHRCD